MSDQLPLVARNILRIAGDNCSLGVEDWIVRQCSGLSSTNSRLIFHSNAP